MNTTENESESRAHAITTNNSSFPVVYIELFCSHSNRMKNFFVSQNKMIQFLNSIRPI